MSMTTAMKTKSTTKNGYFNYSNDHHVQQRYQANHGDNDDTDNDNDVNSANDDVYYGHIDNKTDNDVEDDAKDDYSIVKDDGNNDNIE